MTLSERLQWILDHRGISASALSLKAGQSRAYVRKLIEREPMRPDFTALERIAAVAEVPSLWLIKGEGAPGIATTNRIELRVEREPEHIPADDEVPLETAALRVMDRDRHTLRDLDAVRAAIRAGPRKEIPDADLGETARRFLDAARQLRLEGAAATPTALLWRVAVGRHQRDAELAAELEEADNAEADAELAAINVKAGQGKANVEAAVAASSPPAQRKPPRRL